MKEKTYCSALSKEIIVSKKGWNHITQGSKKRRRNSKDLVNKLSLLKAAKYVIKNSRNYRIEKRDGNEYLVLEGETNMNKKHERIRVILKKDNSNHYELFSVMRH